MTDETIIAEQEDSLIWEAETIRTEISGTATGLLVWWQINGDQQDGEPMIAPWADVLKHAPIKALVEAIMGHRYPDVEYYYEDRWDSETMEDEPRIVLSLPWEPKP